MITGIRHYENASCKVLICTALPRGMRAKTREIVSVDVPENLRKQGMATQLLMNICDEADAHKIVLTLFPKPFGTGPMMTQDQLIDWYSNKFGFHAIQSQPVVMMARMPGSTPGPFKPSLITEMIVKGMK